MQLNDIPLFSMLKDKMGYLTARQKVISENVANADTPGFTPKDLRPFEKVLASHGASLGLARTGGAYLSGGGVSSTSAVSGKALAMQPVNAPDSETTMNGNSVVLEEQMMKLSESRSDYDTAVSLYEQSLTMLQTAIRRPGA